MAKTYLNTTKYMIKMKFEIDGIVDKPDIIGAIFGQSEGLLGDEMDLKELQKNGKLGRIEINHTTSMGKTKGEVLIPSSLDMAETSLLAAGVETVDKVGPCEAKFELMDVEDTRTQKRGEIKDRAKEILKKLMDKSSPDTQMLSEEIRENVRAADIVEYGADKLPAGPDIDLSDEIIVVEGRADVLNLLKNQIKNVVGMNGSNISPTLVDLTKKKTVTAFVDGDRGGTLNVRKLMQMAKVDYFAQAPDGKEVEELTRKEILLSLKRKAPASEIENEREPRQEREHSIHREFRHDRNERPIRHERFGSRPPFGERPAFGDRPAFVQRSFSERPPFGERHSFGDRPFGERRFEQRQFGNRADRGPRPFNPRDRRGGDRRPMRNERFGPRTERTQWPQERAERKPFSMDANEEVATPQPKLSVNEETLFKPHFDGLRGTMNAKIIGPNNEVVKEVKVKDIVKELGTTPGANAVVFDGVITKRLMDCAEKSGIKYVIGAKKGKIDEKQNIKAIIL